MNISQTTIDIQRIVSKSHVYGAIFLLDSNGELTGTRGILSITGSQIGFGHISGGGNFDLILGTMLSTASVASDNIGSIIISRTVLELQGPVADFKYISVTGAIYFYRGLIIFNNVLVSDIQILASGQNSSIQFLPAGYFLSHIAWFEQGLFGNNDLTSVVEFSNNSMVLLGVTTTDTTAGTINRAATLRVVNAVQQINLLRVVDSYINFTMTSPHSRTETNILNIVAVNDVQTVEVARSTVWLSSGFSSTASPNQYAAFHAAHVASGGLPGISRLTVNDTTVLHHRGWFTNGAQPANVGILQSSALRVVGDTVGKEDAAVSIVVSGYFHHNFDTEFTRSTAVTAVGFMGTIRRVTDFLVERIEMTTKPGRARGLNLFLALSVDDIISDMFGSFIVRDCYVKMAVVELISPTAQVALFSDDFAAMSNTQRVEFSNITLVVNGSSSTLTNFQATVVNLGNNITGKKSTTEFVLQDCRLEIVDVIATSTASGTPSRFQVLFVGKTFYSFRSILIERISIVGDTSSSSNKPLRIGGQDAVQISAVRINLETNGITNFTIRDITIARVLLIAPQATALHLAGVYFRNVIAVEHFVCDNVSISVVSAVVVENAINIAAVRFGDNKVPVTVADHGEMIFSRLSVTTGTSPSAPLIVRAGSLNVSAIFFNAVEIATFNASRGFVVENSSVAVQSIWAVYDAEAAPTSYAPGGAVFAIVHAGGPGFNQLPALVVTDSTLTVAGGAAGAAGLHATALFTQGAFFDLFGAGLIIERTSIIVESAASNGTLKVCALFANTSNTGLNGGTLVTSILNSAVSGGNATFRSVLVACHNCSVRGGSAAESETTTSFSAAIVNIPLGSVFALVSFIIEDSIVNASLSSVVDQHAMNKNDSATTAECSLVVVGGLFYAVSYTQFRNNSIIFFNTGIGMSPLPRIANVLLMSVGLRAENLRTLSFVGNSISSTSRTALGTVVDGMYVAGLMRQTAPQYTTNGTVNINITFADNSFIVDNSAVTTTSLNEGDIAVESTVSFLHCVGAVTQLGWFVLSNNSITANINTSEASRGKVEATFARFDADVTLLHGLLVDDGHLSLESPFTEQLSSHVIGFKNKVYFTNLSGGITVRNVRHSVSHSRSQSTVFLTVLLFIKQIYASNTNAGCFVELENVTAAYSDITTINASTISVVGLYSAGSFHHVTLRNTHLVIDSIQTLSLVSPVSYASSSVLLQINSDPGGILHTAVVDSSVDAVVFGGADNTYSIVAAMRAASDFTGAVSLTLNNTRVHGSLFNNAGLSLIAALSIQGSLDVTTPASAVGEPEGFFITGASVVASMNRSVHSLGAASKPQLAMAAIVHLASTVQSTSDVVLTDSSIVCDTFSVVAGPVRCHGFFINELTANEHLTARNISVTVSGAIEQHLPTAAATTSLDTYLEITALHFYDLLDFRSATFDQVSVNVRPGQVTCVSQTAPIIAVLFFERYVRGRSMTLQPAFATFTASRLSLVVASFWHNISTLVTSSFSAVSIYSTIGTIASVSFSHVHVDVSASAFYKGVTGVNLYGLTQDTVSNGGVAQPFGVISLRNFWVNVRPHPSVPVTLHNWGGIVDLLAYRGNAHAGIVIENATLIHTGSYAVSSKYSTGASLTRLVTIGSSLSGNNKRSNITIRNCRVEARQQRASTVFAALHFDALAVNSNNFTAVYIEDSSVVVRLRRNATTQQLVDSSGGEAARVLGACGSCTGSESPQAAQSPIFVRRVDVSCGIEPEDDYQRAIMTSDDEKFLNLLINISSNFVIVNRSIPKSTRAPYNDEAFVVVIEDCALIVDIPPARGAAIVALAYLWPLPKFVNITGCSIVMSNATHVLPGPRGSSIPETRYSLFTATFLFAGTLIDYGDWLLAAQQPATYITLRSNKMSLAASSHEEDVDDDFCPGRASCSFLKIGNWSSSNNNTNQFNATIIGNDISPPLRGSAVATLTGNFDGNSFAAGSAAAFDFDDNFVSSDIIVPLFQERVVGGATVAEQPDLSEPMNLGPAVGFTLRCNRWPRIQDRWLEKSLLSSGMGLQSGICDRVITSSHSMSVSNTSIPLPPTPSRSVSHTSEHTATPDPPTSSTLFAPPTTQNETTTTTSNWGASSSTTSTTTTASTTNAATTTTTTRAPRPRTKTHERTLTPLPPTPAPKPVVQPGTSAMTTTSTALAVLSVNPAVGPLAVRAGLLSIGSSCGQELAPLDVATNPTRLEVESLLDYRYWAGAALGNAMLCAAFGTVVIAGVLQYQHLFNKKADRQLSVAVALASTFWLVMSQPVIVGFIATATFSEVNNRMSRLNIAVGIWTIATTVLYPIWIFYRVHKELPLIHFKEEPLPKDANVFKKLIAYLFGSYKELEWGDPQCDLRIRWGWLFDHTSMMSLAVSEVVCGFAINVVLGTMQNPSLSQSECQVRSIVALIFHLPPTILSIGWRPFLSRFDLWTTPMMWLMNTVMSVLVVLKLFGSDIGVGLDAMGALIGVAGMIASLGLVFNAYDVAMRAIARKQKLKDEKHEALFREAAAAAMTAGGAVQRRRSESPAALDVPLLVVPSTTASPPNAATAATEGLVEPRHHRLPPPKFQRSGQQQHQHRDDEQELLQVDFGDLGDSNDIEIDLGFDLDAEMAELSKSGSNNSQEDKRKNNGNADVMM